MYVMGQALYRKYRPHKFSEAIGQDAITKTLEEAVKSGRISHAYLFAGPRGVGKTSVARILAHEVNALPYQHDTVHLDIIEIDAASNRRIDEIRDLREKVHIAPSSAKYKIYIIDEVHMLTKEAFNALLKTLEEPPAHCIFILATTEAHKLPETIISRTQRFNFKPISSSTVKSHLQSLAKKEKINIDNNALTLLADFSDGSLRDIIGMLDQLSANSRKVTETDVRNLLGIPPNNVIKELAEHLEERHPHEALKTLEHLKEQGANPVTVARSLGRIIRQKLLQQELSGRWVSRLLKELSSVSAAASPQETLELAVLDAASRDINENETKNKPKLPPPNYPDVEQDINHKKSSFSLDHWNEILVRVKQEAPSLYTALRLAEPSINNDHLRLDFRFPLHQKKIKEAKSIKLIAQLIKEVSGDSLIIDCVVDKTLAKKQDVTSRKSDFVAIKSIFGSAEVLES